MARPAEYRDGMTHCADCGTELIGEHPLPRMTDEKAPCPRPLKKRLLATCLIAGALLAAMWLPHPLLDQDALDSVLHEDRSLAAVELGPLHLGVTPFLAGFVLVELFALAVGRLRRRRLSDLGLRSRLLIASLVTGAVWAALQGISTAFWLEGLAWQLAPNLYNAPDLVPHPGWAFRLSNGLVMAAGSGLFVLAAVMIDRIGTGRGFAVAIVVDVLSGLPSGLAGLWKFFLSEVVTPKDLFLFGVILIGLVLGLRWFFRLGDRLVGRTPVRLGPPDTARRLIFSGGEVIEEAELIAEFE